MRTISVLLTETIVEHRLELLTLFNTYYSKIEATRVERKFNTRPALLVSRVTIC